MSPYSISDIAFSGIPIGRVVRCGMTVLIACKAADSGDNCGDEIAPGTTLAGSIACLADKLADIKNLPSVE